MWKRIFPYVSSLTWRAMLAATVLSCGPVSAQGVGGGVLAFPAADKAAVNKEKLDAALEQYFSESDKALNSRLAELRIFFDEKKPGTLGFAQSLLELQGKLMLGGGIIEDIIGEIDVANGGTRKASAVTRYVKERFRADVFDPDDARKAIDTAVSGFSGDIAQIESRLLVKLRADVGDGDLNVPPPLPAKTGIGNDHYESLINDTVNGAISDVMVSMGMSFVSGQITGKLLNQVISDDTPGLDRLVYNIAANIAVDMALKEAAKQAGYNPEKKLADRTNAGIDRIREAVIDGDLAAFKCYPSLSILRRAHPDQAVRDACQRADEEVTKTANLGLRDRMSRLRNDRYRRLWTVLTAQLVGEEAASSPFNMYTPLDASKCSPPDVIIRWADTITAEMGGNK